MIFSFFLLKTNYDNNVFFYLKKIDMHLCIPSYIVKQFFVDFASLAVIY